MKRRAIRVPPLPLLALLLASPPPLPAAPTAVKAAAGVLLPTSQQKGHKSRYTLDKPPDGWEKPGFNDTAWKEGTSGFGPLGMPGARTEWKTSDIWVRIPFRLKRAPAGDLPFRVFHDEDVEIFLNGIPAARRTGFVTEYVAVPMEPAARASLKAGDNLLAYHCRQTGGGQFIDVGIGDESAWENLASAVVADWMLQDGLGNEGFTSADDARIETAAIETVLQELEAGGAALRAELGRLVSSRAPGSDPRWRELYVKACEARRELRLKPLLARTSKIVFAKHWNVGGSHYAYTECQSDAQAERHWVPGGALCLLEQKGLYGEVTPLVNDPGGIIRNPDVSYDARKILFAWKKDDRKDDYHLYEYDVAGKRTRQLTDGLGYADYEGCYLPTGDIVFSSTRCVQTVDCWWTEVSNLYTCDKDGKRLRRLGYDQVHTNFPTVTDDGRILYTRWEYNDRGQLFPQPLFQMYLDGTAQTECYGNNSWFPTTILHARQIPGTQKILGVATGHHSDQSGKLILLDPAKGRQENQGAQLVAPVRATNADRIDGYGQDGDQFQYPYPLDETRFLVTYAPVDPGRAGKKGFGLYLMDLDGRRELLAWDPALSCNQPVPLAPRPKGHVRPSTVDYRKTTGTYYVQDVYYGPGLQGIARGTIKSLRVVALEYRAAGIGHNGNGGPAGGALVSTPVAIGNGTWDTKIILGSVPVEADGSAYFTVPARTPVYFQLLDGKNHVVQTMRSWSTLQPGESFACIGCHENKNEAAPSGGAITTLALRKPAQALRPFYGRPRGFSFPKEIQPILDAKCVSCHSGEAGKPFGLTAKEVVDEGAKRRWSEAYLALTHAAPDDKGRRSAWRGQDNHPVVNWVSAQSAPPMLPPYSVGAAKSRLIEMLEKGHEGVKLSPEEMDKIAAWIDLAVPFCGDYREAHAWSKDEMAKYDRYEKKRKDQEAQEERELKAFLADRGRP